MDEPLVLVARLDDLADMALTDNKYERATIYATANTILAAFVGSKLSSNQAVMDLLRAACFYLSAAVGYDFIKATPEQCVVKAHDKLSKLRGVINSYYY